MKDTIVQGSLRATDTLFSTTAQFQILRAPTTSGGTTFGPGTSGQVLKSNGTSVYWATDSNDNNAVTQTATTTSAAYELLFSATADNTTRTEGARKTSTLTYNPSTKALSTGGTVNGLTLTAATTGFTIAGGTTSKTLTVNADCTIGTGTSTCLAYYSASNAISGHSLAHFLDTYSSSTANGINELVLGNEFAKTSNGSAYGKLALCSPGTKGTHLVTAENSTSWYTATLPAKTGTIAYTSDITATAVGLGNVENTKLSTWAGSSNITTIGTLTGTLTINLTSTARDIQFSVSNTVWSFIVGNARDSNHGSYISFWHRSANNSNAAIDYYEMYDLPACTNNLTGNVQYNILTTKNAVTVEQGGTGATTVAGALSNLGLTNAAIKQDKVQVLNWGSYSSGTVTLSNAFPDGRYLVQVQFGDNGRYSSFIRTPSSFSSSEIFSFYCGSAGEAILTLTSKTSITVQVPGSIKLKAIAAFPWIDLT